MDRGAWWAAVHGVAAVWTRLSDFTFFPFLSPEELPNPGIETWSPALQADSLPSGPPGRPRIAPWHQMRLPSSLSCLLLEDHVVLCVSGLGLTQVAACCLTNDDSPGSRFIRP